MGEKTRNFSIIALFLLLIPSVSPQVSISLIENTDYCLIDCYAVIELENLGDTDFIANTENFDLWYDKSDTTDNPLIFEIQEEKDVIYQDKIVDYEDKNVCIPNNTTTICYNDKVFKGIHYEDRIEKEYETIRQADIKLNIGEKKRYRIYIKKQAKLGENNIDWKIRLMDFIPDMAWFNSSWDFRYNLTINNTASISHDYEVLRSQNKGINITGTVCETYPNSTRVVWTKTNTLMNFQWYNSSRKTFYLIYNYSFPAGKGNDTISIYCDNSSNYPSVNKTIFAFWDDMEMNSMSRWKTYSTYGLCSLTLNSAVGKYAFDCTNQFAEDNADFSLDSSVKPIYVSEWWYEYTDDAIDNDGTAANVDAIYLIIDGADATHECGYYSGAAWNVLKDCNVNQWYLWNYELNGSNYKCDIWINDTKYGDNVDCWRFETSPTITRKVLGAGLGDGSRDDEVFISHTKFRMYYSPSTVTVGAMETQTTTTTTVTTTTTTTIPANDTGLFRVIITDDRNIFSEDAMVYVFQNSNNITRYIKRISFNNVSYLTSNVSYLLVVRQGHIIDTTDKLFGFNADTAYFILFAFIILVLIAYLIIRLLKK